MTRVERNLLDRSESMVVSVGRISGYLNTALGSHAVKRPRHLGLSWEESLTYLDRARLRREVPSHL